MQNTPVPAYKVAFVNPQKPFELFSRFFKKYPEALNFHFELQQSGFRSMIMSKVSEENGRDYKWRIINDSESQSYAAAIQIARKEVMMPIAAVLTIALIVVFLSK